MPAQDASAYDWYDYQPEQKSIKTVNGKFYAYIVLLFNENPHFVNIIQKDTIPLKVIGDEGFHIKAYKSYLNTLRDGPMGKLAQQMLAVYLEPTKYNDSHLAEIENALVKYNIILRFSKDKNSGSDRIILDYCIFGKKVQVTVKHPLFEIREKIYNIQPFIYYDEFSTSNSTFYFNMIYINPDEVNNDYIIAKRIINGENVNSMFFVGSRVTENMRYCLQRSFRDKKSIKEEIWKMFAIHELTHKVLNNKYNCFDQVTGEELSLSGTIYYNPFLGLSILYSYLNYNSINPHRVAAVNFIKFVAERQGKNEMVAKPGLLKNMTESELRTMAREHFNFMLEKVK
ncbi:MAG: hypothetical protein MUD12_01310 [Spirochaetes bacterium]|nr:hypothetical protein [Spirochaetota bacterium]